MEIPTLKYDAHGLIPVVVQDFYTKEVLTVAYMNETSLKATLEDKLMTFWSRSRQELWRKGETSNNFQHLVSLKSDCDNDALVAQVIKDGPACHTGAESCFFNTIFQGDQAEKFKIEDLYDLLQGRKDVPQEKSYTSYLFAKGKEKILKKVGEESTEVVIAAMKDDKQETIFEVSDVAYHVLVLMVEMGITVADIKEELSKRHVVDHKVKQETMQ